MASSPAQPKLLDQVRARIRVKHYSIRTEQAYVDWIKRFIVHFDQRHPRDLGAAEVVASVARKKRSAFRESRNHRSLKSPLSGVYRNAATALVNNVHMLSRNTLRFFRATVARKAGVGCAMRTRIRSSAFAPTAR